jgi:hypothetical protein
MTTPDDNFHVHVDPPGARTAYTGTLPIMRNDPVGALHLAIDARRWATASNMVSDARRAADAAARVADTLAAVWDERGPSGNARGWPVAIDTPNPADVPQQVDDRWGSVA